MCVGEESGTKFEDVDLTEMVRSFTGSIFTTTFDCQVRLRIGSVVHCNGGL